MARPVTPPGGAFLVQPGFGAPPGSWSQPPPVEKKKSKLWLWILIGVAVVVIGGGAAVGLGVLKLVGFVTAPIDATNDYFAALKADDTAKARSLLCSSMDSETLEPEGSVEAYDFTRSEFSGSAGYVEGTVTIDGEAQPMSVDVIKEEGGWKVCGFSRGRRIYDDDEF